MLLLEMRAVSMIFVAVPRMVVVALSILVVFFVVISVIGSRYSRTAQGRARHEAEHGMDYRPSTGSLTRARSFNPQLAEL